MERGMQGGLKQATEREGPQQAAIRYFESGTPQQTFVKTLDSLWVQAQAIFGEDAQQVICDAVHSDSPTNYVKGYLPTLTAA